MLLIRCPYCEEERHELPDDEFETVFCVRQFNLEHFRTRRLIGEAAAAAVAH
ncbi:hypothetical protein [Aliihoeflea sp. PC F10.4]